MRHVRQDMDEYDFVTGQGYEMGRPSQLALRASRKGENARFTWAAMRFRSLPDSGRRSSEDYRHGKEMAGALTAEDFQALVEAEAAALYALQQQDVVREEDYFRDDRNEAVLILEAVSVTAAETALDSLPFVKAGLIRFELIPLKPYPGICRLFRRI